MNTACEMVERVRRAMVIADGGSPDIGVPDFRLARAAIQAMREPTMAMELAAQASDHRPSTIWNNMIDEALK